jgi:hypothetical protein
MRTLVAAFLAIAAINGAPGLSAGVSTYLTVLVVLAAAALYIVARRRRTGREANVGRVDAAAGPTFVQYIYTTAPVITTMPTPRCDPAANVGRVYVPADDVGQVYLPGSVYRQQTVT